MYVVTNSCARVLVVYQRILGMAQGRGIGFADHSLSFAWAEPLHEEIHPPDCEALSAHVFLC